MRIELTRFAYCPDATFGKLKVNDFECYTVERPWLDNRTSISCIPEGSYCIELGTYHRGGYKSYEILDVPDRTYIKIHIGNTCEDVHGCIALGSRLGSIRGHWAVMSSKQTYHNFMEATNNEQHGQIVISSDTTKGII